MNGFEINSTVEKAKAMVKLNMVQLIWNIFRLIEIALAIILLYWVSTRLPFAIRISGDYFRRLINLALSPSPIFVFLITNVIVFTLVSKTKTKTDQNSSETEYLSDDNNIVMNRDRGENGFDVDYYYCINEEIVNYEDKQVVIVEDSMGEKVAAPAESKQYRRSQSEKKLKEELSKGSDQKFRRSETMICEKRVIGLVDHDELSNEEFQRRIESFIAKQVKFHLQEKSAIVTASC